MTRVDFYLLGSDTPEARLYGVCRVVERVVQSRQRVFIHATDRPLLCALDEALWQFSTDSFVAHTLLDARKFGGTVDATAGGALSVAVAPGPVERDQNDRDPVDRDPVDRDPVDRDPVDRDPVERDPVERDPVERDPVERDPVERDPVERDPVELGCGEPASDRQVLVNLSDVVPPFFSRFERTIEVVDNDTAVRDAGRRRFRFYRERGYPLHHHTLG